MPSPESTGLPIISDSELVSASLRQSPLVIPEDLDYFVRRVDINMFAAAYTETNGLSLIDLLGVADEAFESFADRCGAEVIAHEWCLAPYEHQAPHPAPIHNRFPGGYTLAARVPVLQKTRPLKRKERRLIGFIGRIEETTTGIRWNDPTPRQFTYGTSAAEGSSKQSKPSLWLHDIDIYLHGN